MPSSIEVIAVLLVLPWIIALQVLARAWCVIDIMVSAILWLGRRPCIIVGLCIVALVLNSTDVNVYRALYGGEDDEAIRFMDTVLSEEKWLAEVESEKHMIEEMPVVKGSVDFFYSDTSANLNKVQASVWCCWAPARRTFKQVLVACDEKEKPTHLEALRALRAKLVSEHMCATHEPDERAVARRRELEASGEAGAAEPADAFDRMRAANARLMSRWCESWSKMSVKGPKFSSRGSAPHPARATALDPCRS